MAAKEEEVADVLWEEMQTLAVEQQQCLHELLPDFTMYKADEYKYLKQNIGYALCGSPKGANDPSTKESCFCNTENLNDTDVVDAVEYDEKAGKVINKIYEKICSTAETDGAQSIYFGIIYNVIFNHKMKIKPKKEEKEEKAKAEVKKEDESKKKDEEELFFVVPVPIFKIRKKKSETAKSTKQENSATAAEVCEQYETWYIDGSARVYKNWADYTKNNNLPECTMVLPKDGVYQPDPAYPCMEDYSTVWLEIVKSPACTWRAKLCTGIDIASNVVGIGTVGLTAVGLFTPLAPVVVISGLVAAGVTGAWTLGRNSQQLVDRSSHEESIHILDRDALAHYLGIAGTTFGFGVIGGSAIISNVAARGMTVHTLARVAFNTVQGGNLLVNGVGIIYQGYNMYDKYKNKEEPISFIDALNLATHLMFFCGSVVKIQFASDIIESTQGRVMSDYKDSLSSKRLRKKFNRTMRNAAENNICKMAENAEVIRYIRNRQDLLSSRSVTNGGNRVPNNTLRNIEWSCERGGRLKVNGILLLDPIEYVTRLVKLGIFIKSDQSISPDTSRSSNDDVIVDQLAKVLCDLLSKFYASDDCPRSTKIPIVPDFEPLLRQMSSMKIDEKYLKKLFEITIKLMKRSRDMDDFLLQIFTFVWQYCKANLKQWGMSLCTQSFSGSEILRRIIFSISEAIDMMLSNLLGAFVSYMESSRLHA